MEKVNKQIEQAPKISHIEKSTPSRRRLAGALLDDIARWILLAVVFVLPFFALPLNGLALSFGKLSLLSLGVVIAFLLYLIARLEDGVLSIPKSSVLGSLGVLCIVFLVASLVSDSMRMSLIGYGNAVGTFSTILVSVLGAFLVSIYFRQAERVLMLLGALVLSFVVVFILQIVHLFGVDIAFLGLAGAKATSVLGKWNDLALFAGLFTVLGIVIHEFFPKTGIIRLITLISIFLSLILLIVVNFTAAWATVGAFSLIIVIYSFTSGRKEGNNRILSPALVTLLFSILFLIFSGSVGTKLGEMGLNSLDVRPSWSTTMSVTGSVLSESRLLGIGPNRFGSAWLLNKPDGVNETIFWNVDFNSGVGRIPTYIATTGIIGLLAWILFLALFLVFGYRAFTKDLGASERGVLLSVYLATLYLWVINMFYNPDVVLSVLPFLLTGIVVSASVGSSLTKTLNHSFARDAKAGFLTVLVIVFLIIVDVSGAYLLVQKYNSFVLFRRGVVVFNESGDLDLTQDYLRRAISASEEDLYLRSLSELHISRLNVIARSEGVAQDVLREQFQNVLGAAIGSAARAVELDPTNYSNYLALGRIYGEVVPLKIDGAYDAASLAYTKAKTLNPRGPAIPLLEARLSISNDDRVLAKEKIQEALALKSNYAEALFLLSQIEADLGNVAEAIRSAEQVAAIAPNDVGVFFQLGLLRYLDGKLETAIVALERAILINPDFANAKYFLGLSYGRLGRSKEAISQFEDIQSTNPDNAELKSILSNLRAGRSPLAGITSPTDRDNLPIQEYEVEQ
ncbi:MAG: hypothetical protein COV07_00990 [Candidatus Vogelbacteria bacterium CG10_big_fil_rev_8_21_14_0_10_45_14]|uniref:Uncharacterized protein n=1 Tax=Candidatus Vogelbacteria bacterium CG10_big_fil_rev_8_21_14_0_10_45_14 TaxID=1975042 RepID=A0A2H0RM31_9BACT|nr:MAG: hypothetical protein COV07_00990 [Candidatus Vogelbacteria bacterium CG10_big_fil_rev_8_21_14_0_10_45_14]